MAHLPSQYRTLAINFPNVSISGAPLPADRMTVPIPAGVNYWVPHKIRCFYEDENSNGTLGLASVQFWTESNGGGASVLTPSSAQALDGLLDTGRADNLNPGTPTDIFTATGITIRQVDAPFGGNYGYVSFTMLIDVLG